MNGSAPLSKPRLHFRTRKRSFSAELWSTLRRISQEPKKLRFVPVNKNIDASRSWNGVGKLGGCVPTNSTRLVLPFSNPAKSNDFILFRVLDVSPSGLRLLTSLRNNFIVRGMRLDVIVSFPMVSQITVRLVVQNVSFISQIDKEYLAIGAQIDGLTSQQSSVIAQYMARFRAMCDSLREFRDSGFAPFGISEAIEYGVVRTETDYREVLNLRHLAYWRITRLPSQQK